MLFFFFFFILLMSIQNFKQRCMKVFIYSICTESVLVGLMTKIEPGMLYPMHFFFFFTMKCG